MKNLMLFVHPNKDFLPEQKTSIKIEIDNSLGLGWLAKDIILATNFPYEYNGVKSILVGDDNYCMFCPTVSVMNVIVELFNRNLIKKDQIYWFHDTDAYQLHNISESEIDLGEADMAVGEFATKPKIGAGSIFFKSTAKDIFASIKEISYKYQTNEEYALNALFSNNRLWLTDIEYSARTKFVPLDMSGSENMNKRIKKLNVSYDFGVDSLSLIYNKAIKPIKIIHFHYKSDILLDSAMYGKNNLKKRLMTERLINIFHKHGVKGVFPKPMKNLMVYTSPKEKALVDKQIENSIKLGWKEEDIVIIKDFSHKYQGAAEVIFHLLDRDLIKETELWWYHDLDVFQLRQIDSSEIDLADTVAGFIDTSNFFFRKGSDKLFEWIRNRAIRLKSTDEVALKTLAEVNYRNINTLYKRLGLDKMAMYKK